jgi:hypothetical protein
MVHQLVVMQAAAEEEEDLMLDPVEAQETQDLVDLLTQEIQDLLQTHLHHQT